MVYYLYIRLYRVVDEPLEKIRSELNKLGEFIKARAEQNRDISYITLTLIKRGRVDGIITIVGDDPDKLEVEREIILGYVSSQLESVIAEKIDKPRISEHIPLPKTHGFFGETA